MDVVAINRENFRYFTPMIPPEMVGELAMHEEPVLLGLVDEETACGVLCGWLEEPELVLRHLYVAFSYRNRGGGALLLNTAEQLLIRSRRGSQLRFSFATVLPVHGHLAEFLMRRDFQDESTEYRMMTVRVKKLLECEKICAFKERHSDRIVCLKQLDKSTRLIFLDMLNKQLGAGERDLDEELTLLYIEDGKISAYMANGCDSENRTIHQVYSFVSGNSHALLLLIGELAHRAEMMELSDYYFYLQPANERSLELIKYLLGDVLQPASVELVKRLETI